MFRTPIYWLVWAVGQVAALSSLRMVVLNKEVTRQRQPYILACTHISHLEAFVVGGVVRRRIDWMARLDLFMNPLSCLLMWAVGVFPIDQYAFALTGLRRAIRRLRRGRVVGMFPEGRVAQGRNTLCRGGHMYRGVCLVSARTGVPVIPVIVLGTEKLNCPDPWLPFRRGRLWVAFGQPVLPPATNGNRRLARQAMATQLQADFVKLYRELLDKAKLDDSIVP